MKENKYSHLAPSVLMNLLDKKYAQLALITNNKFNLERRALELNEEITALRKQINRVNQEKATNKTGENND